MACATIPAQAADSPLRVALIGPAGSLETALRLPKEVQIVTDADQADVLVVNDTVNDPASLARLVSQGKGLVLVLAPGDGADTLTPLLGANTTLVQREAPLSLISATGVEDPLMQQILWTSAPQIRERYQVIGSQLQPLVIGYEDGSVVLGQRKLGQGTIYVLAAFLNGQNPQIQQWAYFNYLIYHLVERAGGREPLSFDRFEGSPVPHNRERAILFAILAGMWLAAGFVFLRVRRYSQAHPEQLNILVADRKEFEQRQAHTDWEEVGFHRPLGGFLLAMMLGLIFFIPLVVYQNLILPVYILPSAQALGIWGRVVQFFNLLWLLFDMGTAAAFIKFYSQFRVNDPRQAIQYGQVYVWWQALSGAFQVGLITAIAGTLLPRTFFAIYTWSVIIHTMIQIPGFYQVMRNSLIANQRFDYAQILDITLAVFAPIVTQPILVTLMIAWGRAHPVFGPSMGGLLGLGMAAYASEALTFLIGLWLYRRLGYNARLLFLAHFDWSVVKSAFRFGVFEMLGSVAWGVGQSVEILITQARLVNYAEIWGNWVLAQNFIYAFMITATLFDDLMPSISEAISHGWKTLSQYYAAMAYKWGGFISGFICAVLLAVADRFIIGASGPEFTRAALYAIPLTIWGAFQYPSWVGDNVQLASNRPYLKASLVAGEQTVRILLAFFLITRFQIYGLIAAYFIGLFTKDIAAYFINHRICFPQRFYFWQSLFAPLLAGASHYLLLRWITGFIWQHDQVTSVLIFFIGILPSYPVYAFLYGLFGGWDNETLDELRRAADLASFMRPLARLFWASTNLGARISPLHGRFPIGIRQAALAEAGALTAERVTI
jgi:O-antigen/teichoic acid export membrane protein